MNDEFFLKQRQSSIPWLISVNVAVALVSLFFLIWRGEDPLLLHFALWSTALAQGKWWEFFTYMWLHADPRGSGVLHIIFNMFTLHMFGRLVEARLGRFSFLGLYLAGGIIAAFAFFVELWVRNGFVIARIAEGEPRIVIGASGAIVAVVTAFAWLWPDAKLFVLFLPFPVKAKYALAGFVVLSFGLLFYPPLAFIGHSAHLGGVATGCVWMWLRRFSRRAQLQDDVFNDYNSLFR
ncbi:MAG: rhomboid family intramembrane serine protease [bacterium]